MKSSNERIKVLEVLMDTSPRTVAEIFAAGEDVFELGSVLKLVHAMADDGLVQEVGESQPAMFAITQEGKAEFRERNLTE